MTIRTGLAALCLLGALAGCSEEAAAPPPLPTAPTSSPTPVALPVPPEATPETPQGAAAFARYYFGEVVNAAYDRLDPTPVQSLSAADCNSCANIVKDIERLRDADLRVAGDRFKVAFAEAAPAEADGSIIVDFRFSSDPYVEKDASGKQVREEPAQKDQDAQVKLMRRGGGWIVAGIRTVEL